MVILKAYRNYDEIMDALAKLPGQWRSHLVSRCGLPGESVSEDAAQERGSRQHYLSLVIAQKKEDESA
jgi:precorrin-2 methylase